MSSYDSADATITTKIMMSNINRKDENGNGLFQFKLSSDGDIEFRDNSANWMPIQFNYDQLTSGETVPTPEGDTCPCYQHVVKEPGGSNGKVRRPMLPDVI